MKSYVYFPSCNFSAASPQAARRIRDYLSQKMAVAGCCRVDKKPYETGNTALYVCQACRDTIQNRWDGRLTLENLFVYLLQDEDFSWPDYSGLKVQVQDCWRDREHPEVFDAVRQALLRMHITVSEMEENREKSVFCGNLHMEPHKRENQALLEKYPGIPLYQMPEEVQTALMREQVEKYTESLIVAACNRCVKGITMGGGKGVHLLELATGTFI